MRLQVVAFDVDGTLYPNRAMYLLSVPFAFRYFGILSAFARVRREIRKIRPINDFYRTQAELFARYRGVPVEKAVETIETVIYGRWESLIRYVKPFPFVGETLGELKKAGLKLAVLSDFPLRNKLKYLNLDGYWDYAKSSEESGYLKPAPEPFQDLVNHFSVPPEEILYVGNSYNYDIDGAKRCGLAAAHLTKNAPWNSDADFSFTDYRELRKWIFSKT
jgi:putative hydrolase of the HAD superfamily